MVLTVHISIHSFKLDQIKGKKNREKKRKNNNIMLQINHGFLNFVYLRVVHLL